MIDFQTLATGSYSKPHKAWQLELRLPVAHCVSCNSETRQLGCTVHAAKRKVSHSLDYCQSNMRGWHTLVQYISRLVVPSVADLGGRSADNEG